LDRSLIEPVTFVLQGPPRGQQRTGGNGRQRYTQKKTRDYEGDIKIMAKIAMHGRRPIEGEALALDLRAVFEIPKSWSRAKRDRALLGEIRPTVKPDLSNVVKTFEDAMNNTVYGDDSYIVDFGRCRKVYGLTPFVVVTIRSADPVSPTNAQVAL
jgi:Holliday junction resolvase RusA-like endonuclease